MSSKVEVQTYTCRCLTSVAILAQGFARHIFKDKYSQETQRYARGGCLQTMFYAWHLLPSNPFHYQPKRTSLLIYGSLKVKVGTSPDEPLIDFG